MNLFSDISMSHMMVVVCLVKLIITTMVMMYVLMLERKRVMPMMSVMTLGAYNCALEEFRRSTIDDVDADVGVEE